jgi:excisionase family DNA binding protein
MPYTVAEAAKAVGRSKSTLLRAIQTGKVSAIRDEASGGWLIEPAELHRVYRIAPADPVHTDANGAARIAELEARLELSERRITDKDDVIADLRRQRDLLQNALTATQARMEVLLADQRPAPPAPVRRGWWRWGRARSGA